MTGTTTKTYPKVTTFSTGVTLTLTDLLHYHQCQLEAKPSVPLERCEQPEQGHVLQLKATALAKPTLGQHQEQTHPVHSRTFQGGLRCTAPSSTTG